MATLNGELFEMLVVFLQNYSMSIEKEEKQEELSSLTEVRVPLHI